MSPDARSETAMVQPPHWKSKRRGRGFVRFFTAEAGGKTFFFFFFFFAITDFMHEWAKQAFVDGGKSGRGHWIASLIEV